jgi:hypothetical protein
VVVTYPEFAQSYRLNPQYSRLSTAGGAERYPMRGSVSFPGDDARHPGITLQDH